MSTKLNLGCGTRYLAEWTNVDFFSTGKDVLAYNLLNGIPFQDNAFDVVYHSHVLEHFPKDRAELFIKECYRVLKPGGVLRVAVPDLEQIVRLYLQQLEQVRDSSTPLNQANYDWSLLEMYDQMVRNTSGGEMGRYWAQPAIINEDWIAARMGAEFLGFRKFLQQEASSATCSIPSRWKRFLKLSTFRNRLLIWLSGEPRLFELFQLARFRSGGEVHQWMYDSHSLGELLRQADFSQIAKTDAFTSSIPDWSDHQWLDGEEGKVRKPDSLFMEGIK
jgi:predicted SAM-dependent methyltransferase